MVLTWLNSPTMETSFRLQDPQMIHSVDGFSNRIARPSKFLETLLDARQQPEHALYVAEIAIGIMIHPNGSGTGCPHPVT